MKRSGLIFFSAFILALAITLFGSPPTTVHAEGITDTCPITFTWLSRIDQGSTHVSGFSSSFSGNAGTQQVVYASGQQWQESLWYDEFSVTNLLTGTIITVTANGDYPYAGVPWQDWPGTIRQPPNIRCTSNDGTNAINGSRISVTQTVVTLTAVRPKCHIGHYYGYPGRLDSAHFSQGGTFSWSYTITTNRVCEPNCGSNLSNTHFSIDTWTHGGPVSWVSSIYTISPTGWIQNTGSFTQTGMYSATVQARASSTTTLLISSQEHVTITSSSWTWYSTLISVTSSSFAVRIANDGDVAADVHQICLTPMALPFANCIVRDWHFDTTTEWIAESAATQHGPSVWYLGPYNVIHQNLALSDFHQSGAFRAVVRASTDGPSALRIVVNDLSGVFEVPVSGSAYANYIIDIIIPTVENIQLRLLTDYNYPAVVTVDSICLSSLSVSADGPPPCGISEADAAQSDSLINNGQFQEVLATFPWWDCDSFSVGFPINIGVNCIPAPTRITSYGWSGGINTGVGRAGWNNVQWSLGMLPSPLASDVSQNFDPDAPADLGKGFNVVFRMRRTYANSRLVVNGTQNFNDTPIGAWTDKAAWFASGNSVRFQADCNGQLCADPVGSKLPDVIQLDSVYVVPGPEIQCGVTVTNPVTPPGECINPDPAFGNGASWNTGGGATIGGSQAILPAGGFIQQLVPAITSGTWGQSNSSLIVGESYSMTVAARLQSQSNPNSFDVIVGASVSGQQTIGTASVTSQSMAETFDFSFTLADDMLNGDAMPLRILAGETGGSVIVLYVCIRQNGGGGLPPSSGCLGEWMVSTGGDIGNVIEPPAFIFNNHMLWPGGSYNLQLAGSFVDEGGSLMDILVNGGGQIEVDAPHDFSFSRGFVAPQSFSQQEYAVQVTAYHAVEYSNICLTENGGAPIVPPPNPLPYPECSAAVLSNPAVQNAGFFILPKYAIGSEYSGTIDSAAYLGEMMYNYAIYPLVCTQISIANWEYTFAQKFNAWWQTLFDKLDEIIRLLRALLDQGGGGGMDPLSMLLMFLLELIKLLFQLLFKILNIFFILCGKVIEAVGKVSIEMTKNENATQFPFDCSGDSTWMCMGLASVLGIDMYFGDWLNILSSIVVTMLTVALVWWAQQEVRNMLEPGSGKSDG